MHLKTFGIVVLLISTAFAALAFAPPVQAQTTNLSDQLVESAGPTSALGGGNAVWVRFGTDAAFGIVYGNQTHPNNVYIVAIKARYLGVGQVYNSSGALIAANHTIKIYTLYAAKLADILEYRDANGNGIADYSSTYNATTGNYTVNRYASDVFYKKVSLSATWNATTVTPTAGATYRTWTFGIEATNLSYRSIATGAPLAGGLPLVRFTFHLNASLVQVDNATVPNFRVTVGTLGGRLYVANVSRLTDLTLASVKLLHYDLKWDQLIQGWTYAGGNSRPMLILTMGAVVANLIPYSVADAWLQHFVNRESEAGAARYNYTAIGGGGAGTANVNNTTGGYNRPLVFSSPLVTFGGNWTQIGKLLWTTNSTVDGVNQTVTAQVFGVWGFRGISDNGGVYFGLALLMGLNYVGGATIVHDPSVQSDVMTNLTFTTTPSNGPLGTYGAVIAGIVILVVIVFAAFVLLSRRRKKDQKEQPPTPPPPQ